MRKIAVVNQKGGVGKSTLSANLSTAYARRGRKTLLADADSQGTARNWRGTGPNSDESEKAFPDVVGADTAEAIETLTGDEITGAFDVVVIDGPPGVYSPQTIDFRIQPIQRATGATLDATVSDEVDDRIAEAVDDFAAAINDYSIRKAGNAAIDLAQFGNEYIQRNEPWKLTDDDPERAEQVIYDCVQLSKALAVLFQPVAPDTCQRLWNQLGEDGDVADATVDVAREAPQGEFDEPDELFEKIEAERVEELNEKLEQRVEAATDDEADDDSDADDTEDDTMSDDTTDADTDAQADELEPIVEDRISFEDFQDLDLRVGEIIDAEGVEDADKLAKLQVDIGHEERQLVAGIKQLHDLSDLPGTRVIIVANLEKAELFGIESNGMLLAAGEEADLLTTHGDAPIGTRIQ